MYVATHYENKPAVLDTKTGVYYFGYASFHVAQARAVILNKEAKQ